MRFTPTRIVDDAFFGDLEIATDDEDGTVTVSGEIVPAVTITRANDAEKNRFTPIGSRRPEDLILTIDGKPGAIMPGPGKWTRASYRVRVRTEDTEYLFKPNSIATTQLRRDNVKLADFSMDDDDGDFLVYWISTRDRALPIDASLGYALSIAFRTGALGVWSMLLRGAEALPD